MRLNRLSVRVAIVASLALAACTSNGSPEAELIVVDPTSSDGQEEVQFAVNDALCTGHDCSGTILAACYDATLSENMLCRLNADGSGTEDALTVGAAFVDPAPDGRHLLLFSSSDSVALLASDGTVVREALPDSARWLTSDQIIVGGANGGFEIVDLEGTLVATVPANSAAGTEMDTDVSASPDGMAFIAPTEFRIDSPTEFWVYRFETKLWSEIGYRPPWVQADGVASWSPDASTIYVLAQTAPGDDFEPDQLLTSELVAVDIASGDHRVVARFGHMAYLAGVLSPDGRIMAVRSTNRTVFVDVATGVVSNQVVTGATSRYPSVSWSPSSDRLALEIGTRIAVIDVSPELEASVPRVMSRDDHYSAYLNPLWPSSD